MYHNSSIGACWLDVCRRGVGARCDQAISAEERFRENQTKKEVAMTNNPIKNPKVVSQAEWLEARKKLLAKEKEHTRRGDEINAERRALPWVKVEKEYVFDAPGGKETLSDLFGDRNQLVITHFMLGPDWEEGCKGCSFGADHLNGVLVHLEQHDVAIVAVSRSPLPKIEAFKKRMGWRFKWVSSFGTDFNYDFHVSFTQEELAKGKIYYNYDWRDGEIDELAGNSVFCKDQTGAVYHTYSRYARGGEPGLTVYSFLDMLPKGREEYGPTYSMMDWLRHHDRYDVPTRGIAEEVGATS
jgi:predicted dithiol-disulfide oxidoreductase (DUF899 family)